MCRRMLLVVECDYEGFMEEEEKIFQVCRMKIFEMILCRQPRTDWLAAGTGREGGGPSSAQNIPRLRSVHFHWIIILLTDTWTEQ